MAIPVWNTKSKRHASRASAACLPGNFNVNVLQARSGQVHRMRIIAGMFKGRMLKTTVGPGYRPAMGKVRQAIFSMLEARGVVWSQTRVLDIFAGSGSLGFEALSRGATHAAFIESSPRAATLIRENARIFGLEESQITVWAKEARAVLGSRPETPFDLVFIDPPYGGNFLIPTVGAVLRNGWLAPDGILNAEVEHRLALDPDTVFPPLACLADRTYGQTRVLVWANNA